MKSHHPSFFHSSRSNRGDDGSRPGDGLSCPSPSAGNASGPPGEPVGSPSVGRPPHNKPAPSSIADKRKTFYRTNDTPPRLKAKKMASDPCKPSEAMVKIDCVVGLPMVDGALLEGPKLLLRAFLFVPLRKADLLIIQGISRKITSFPPHESQSQGNASLLARRSFSFKSQTREALSPRRRPIDAPPLMRKPKEKERNQIPFYLSRE